MFTENDLFTNEYAIKHAYKLYIPYPYIGVLEKNETRKMK